MLAFSSEHLALSLYHLELSTHLNPYPHPQLKGFPEKIYKYKLKILIENSKF